MRALTLLVCGLCAAGDAQSRFVPPRLEILESVEVPHTLWSQDVPVRVRALRVRGTAGVLWQSYADAFARAGFYLLPQSETPRITAEPMLAALDPEQQVAFAVYLQPHRDRTTTLILTETHLSRRRARAEADFAPLFPGATQVFRSDQEIARSVFFRVDAPPAEVTGFYRELLGGLGFALEAGAGEVFVRGGERLELHVERQREGFTTVLLMQRPGLSGEADTGARAAAPLTPAEGPARPATPLKPW